MRRRRRAPAQPATGLRAIPLFGGCTDVELRRVRALVDDIEVAPGEVVTSELDVNGDSYVIASGEASVVVRERSVERLGAGDVFGELAGLWPGRPTAATVTAITSMRVLVVDRHHLAELVAIPCVAQQLAGDAVARLHAQRRARCP